MSRAFLCDCCVYELIAFRCLVLHHQSSTLKSPLKQLAEALDKAMLTTMSRFVAATERSHCTNSISSAPDCIFIICSLSTVYRPIRPLVWQDNDHAEASVLLITHGLISL